MSAAVITLTIHMERKDHSRKLTDADAMRLAETELDGADWWDDDYGYELSVTSAKVVYNDTRMDPVDTASKGA